MTGIGPTPERPPAPIPEPSDWYYRIGERERGPLTLTQLTDLVASSGDLAREIVVRRHAEGEWVPYETIDATTARRLHADWLSRSAQPRTAVRDDAVCDDAARDAVVRPANAVRAPSRVGTPNGNFFAGLRAHWRIVVAVLAWAGLNVVLWNVLDPFQSTDRRYYQLVSDAAQKAHDARTQGLDDAARGRLAASVLVNLKPIVADLKKSASVSQPIRQHLMWAAKDQLPKLFSASGKELGECDNIFQWHMYEAGRRLGIDVPRPETSIVFQ